MNHLEIYYDDLAFRSCLCPDYLSLSIFFNFFTFKQKKENKCRWQKQKYCKYAHGEHNLRCKEFISKGKCSRGEFCPNVHKVCFL